MQKFNIRLSLLIIIAFSIFSSQQAYSQINTMYFMDGIHQSNYTNPAFQSNCNGFIGLPALSTINFGVLNSGFTYKDLIHLGTGIYRDSLILDVNNLKDKLGKNNYFMLETQIPILGIGFWAKDYYFTFDISNKTKARISYPEDLIKLIDGNAKYIGTDNALEINDVGPDFINYNEFAFGLSKRITHRLTVGAKLKILAGIASIESKNSDLKLTTEDITYAMTLETDINLNTSLPLTYKRDEDGNIEGFEEYETSYIAKDLLSFKNFGLGMDFGATYQFNDELRLFASITDLGFISWKNNTVNLIQKGSFEYTGLNLDSAFVESDYSEFDALTDSITNFFTFDETNSKYTTFLQSNIYIGATYNITDFMNVGLLSRTYFYDRKIHQSATLSTNFAPVKWFSGTLSYSAMNRSYNNIGLGLAFKAGPTQFYIVTDNLNAAIWPKASKSINIMLGLNLNLGCGKRDDYSIINNKKSTKEVDFM
ncbi:MAG: hypothetical protein JXR51_06460 [Bacteroidales bacterium]|nr:hypothetical protein [Bacteroidales bacterium]MBN2756804.1 hypothetical protein [Bacteroidales bacterium]